MTRPPDDPTRRYQVVISFRLDIDPNVYASQLGLTEHFRNLFTPTLIKPAWTVHGLNVAVRVIGAAGESGTDEGRYDRPSRTEDVDRVRTLYDSEDVDAGGKL